MVTDRLTCCQTVLPNYGDSPTVVPALKLLVWGGCWRGWGGA
ncbi:MAG: hypothetical protein ACK5QS_13715 [Pseudanabaenaceae cyanobacterium]